MDKIEIFSEEEKIQLLNNGIKQLEANYINAKVNEIASEAALQAVRAFKNSEIASAVTHTES